jgi:hypothetical protein
MTPVPVAAVVMPVTPAVTLMAMLMPAAAVLIVQRQNDAAAQQGGNKQRGKDANHDRPP